MTADSRAQARDLQRPSRGRLLAILGGGLVAAGAIHILFVLPAEFGADPTGFGRWSGLVRLAAEDAAPPHAASSGTPGLAGLSTTPFRTDSVRIPLRTADAGPSGSELEYKVRMKAGDSLVYSWTVSGLTDPEEFYFDFHGETPVGPDHPEPRVVEYHQATGAESHGFLVAPIPGVHGWYLQNQSGAGVVVHLRLSGFYELVPPGEYGNEAGILPESR